MNWSAWAPPWRVTPGQKLLLKLLLVRLLSCSLLGTYFTPDEFWQGSEVAHSIVFGKGHLTWEWQPEARLRGIAHPLLYALFYRLLAACGLDTGYLIANTPIFVGGIFAALCDYATYTLALRLLPEDAAAWVLCLQMTNWFNFFCLARPYSNCLEAALTTMAVARWAPVLWPQRSPQPLSRLTKEVFALQQQQQPGVPVTSPTTSATNSSASVRSSHEKAANNPTRIGTGASDALGERQGVAGLDAFPNAATKRAEGPSVDASVVSSQNLGMRAEAAAVTAGGPGAGQHEDLSAAIAARAGVLATEQSSNSSDDGCALLLGAVCVALRPSSAVLWGVLGAIRLYVTPFPHWPRYLLLKVLPRVGLVTALSASADRAFYGEWVIVGLNFLRFNVLEGQSAVFGTQPWHWNFTQGLPVMLGVSTPLFLAGAFKGPAAPLGWLVMYFTAVHSLSPHKEWRFLLPALQLANVCAGFALWRHVNGGNDSSSGRQVACCASDGSSKDGSSSSSSSSVCAKPAVDAAASPVISNQNGCSCETKSLAEGAAAARGNNAPAKDNGAASLNAGSSSSGQGTVGGTVKTCIKHAVNGASAAPFVLSSEAEEGRLGGRKRRRAFAIAGLLIGNVPLALYLSVVHQRGPLAVTAALRRELTRRRAQQGERVDVDVHFLMPCHSTPLYSHLHVKGLVDRLHLWSLDCSPVNRLSPGGSESDRFEADPAAFAAATYSPKLCSKTDDDEDGNSQPRPGVGAHQESEAGAFEDSSAACRELPDYVVMYDTHALEVLKLLSAAAALSAPPAALAATAVGGGGGSGVARTGAKEPRYVKVIDVFHTHFSGDTDAKATHKRIVVLRREDR